MFFVRKWNLGIQRQWELESDFKASSKPPGKILYKKSEWETSAWNWKCVFIIDNLKVTHAVTAITKNYKERNIDVSIILAL